MKRFRVGWRVAIGWKTGEPVLVAIGSDIFLALTPERAQDVAVRRVPGRIHLTGECTVGIRYVEEIV